EVVQRLDVAAARQGDRHRLGRRQRQVDALGRRHQLRQLVGHGDVDVRHVPSPQIGFLLLETTRPLSRICGASSVSAPLALITTWPVEDSTTLLPAASSRITPPALSPLESIIVSLWPLTEAISRLRTWSETGWSLPL